jgi:hypothetical protein
VLVGRGAPQKANVFFEAAPAESPPRGARAARTHNAACPRFAARKQRVAHQRLHTHTQLKPTTTHTTRHNTPTQRRRTKAIIADQLPKKSDCILFCELRPLQVGCRVSGVGAPP